jgi:hypothetical protein
MYKQRDDDESIELPFVRTIKVVALLCALLAGALLIDFILPVACNTDKIQQRLFDKEDDRFGGTIYKFQIVTTSSSFDATPVMFEDAAEGAQIEVCCTPLFRFVKQVSGTNSRKGTAFSHHANPPVYNAYGAFPIALLFLSLVALLFKRDEIIAYCAGIISIVFLISILIII